MSEDKPSLHDVPQRTQDGHLAPHVEWEHLEFVLAQWMDARCGAKLELEPEFQRGHVWTRSQQVGRTSSSC